MPSLQRLRLKDLWPASVYLRSYILIVLAEAAGDIAIESYILAKFEFFSALLHQDVPDEKATLPVYLGIFVLAHIFQFGLAWEAIYNRNLIQIFGLGIFNFAFLVYAVIQISEIKQAFAALNDMELDRLSVILVSIIPGIIGAAGICYIFLTWHIYRLMGWEIFKRIGADRLIKKMYLNYQVFICLLKFDAFFFVAFSLQFVLLVLDQSALERWLTLTAVPVSILLLYLAYLSVRKENKPLIYLVLTACVGAAAYFLFKTFRIYQGKQGAYQLVYKTLTVFAALAFALLVATFIVAVRCLRNFGFGLKQHLTRNPAPKSSPKDLDAIEDFKLGNPYNFSAGTQMHRMSID